MKQDIIEYAKQIGFSAIGFAASCILYEEYRYFKYWVAMNYHSGAKYLESERPSRHNPSLLLDGLKTIIVVANPYNNNVEFSNPNVRIAKYALNEDYHIVIKNKLRQLGNYVFQKSNANFRCFVDSGWLLEKELAVKAGLGWRGKNSLVINEKIGSYFNIGVILTDVEIEPDKEVNNRCGTCTLCIDVCPTNAINPSKIVDCRKCISYHTIENRGELPTSLLPKIREAGYVFGCDICQDVCPYNVRLKKDNKTLFDTNIFTKDFSEEQYNALFADTPIVRSKYSYFKTILDTLL